MANASRAKQWGLARMPLHAHSGRTAECLMNRASARITPALMLGLVVLAALATSADGQAAVPEEVVMEAQDIVHMAWINGPTYSDKLKSSPQWPKFPELGNTLLLRGSSGHCVKSGASGLEISYCRSFTDGLQLRHVASSGALIDSTDSALCPAADGTSVSLSASCSQPANFSVTETGAYLDVNTGKCLAPSPGDSFGTSDTNALILSDDCASWAFSLWTDWLRPPGYEDGFKVGGSAASSSSDPPRWSMQLGTPCEQYRIGMTDESGSRATGLIATRGSDGAAFPRTLANIWHMGWPQGAGCKLFFFMEPIPETGLYPDVSEWNAFFPSGETITFSRDLSSGTAACSPGREGYTGFSGPKGGYCKASSERLDTEKHLAMWSGRVGVVIDADAPEGNFVSRLGAVTSGALEQAAAQEGVVTEADKVAAALPGASLTANLTLIDGSSGDVVVLSLGTAVGPAQMGLVRQGWVMNHVIVTRLGWGGGDGSALAGALDGVEFWLEVSVWGDRVVLEVAWDEAAVALAGGVTAEVAVDLAVGGAAMASEVQGVGLGKGGVVLAVGEGGSLMGSSSSVTVTSTAGTAISRDALGDVFVVAPKSLQRCGTEAFPTSIDGTFPAPVMTVMTRR